MCAFPNKPKIGGIIGFLGLDDFWNSCTQEEQNALIRYYQSGLGASPNTSPIIGDVYVTTSPLGYLSTYILWATNEHNYDFAHKIIRYCEKYNEPVVDVHFFYNNAIECFYRQREIEPNALNQAIAYCLKDIDLFPIYKHPLVHKIGVLPRIPSFQQLAIIYEKNGEYEKAIEVCEQALGYELDDGTKGGFAGRIQKLQKKLRGKK